jgi:hypothetical protein
MELTQSYLKSVLYYEPETGEFTFLLHSRKAKIGSLAGCIDRRGYRVIRMGKKNYSLHRLAFLYMTGWFPPYEVDHVNGVRHDNRWANLRAVTARENMKNRQLSKNNTSGIIGVGWHSRSNKWQAYIAIDGALHHLGRFSDKSAAINARKEAEKKHGYHENHGRSAA